MTIWTPVLLIPVPATHLAVSTIGCDVVCLVALRYLPAEQRQQKVGECGIVMVPSGISPKVNVFASCWKALWVRAFCSICICLVLAFFSPFLILNILSYCREDNSIHVGECH